ncbi:MAG: NIF family HAD-type phosphatase [Bdellovibrionales bacterium]
MKLWIALALWSSTGFASDWNNPSTGHQDPPFFQECQAFLASVSPFRGSVSQFQQLPHHWQYLYGESEPTPRFTIQRAHEDHIPNASSVSDELYIEKSERFNIDALMRDFSLSRLQAAEVQAQYRRAHKLIASDLEFTRIVSDVRAGRFMSGINEQDLLRNPTVVVLDVDGTLLDQDHSSWKDGLTTFSFRDEGKYKTVHVSMTPGWDILIKKLVELKVPVVLYSRNSDYLIQALVDFIQLDGRPLRSYVAGVLSSSHMVDTGQFATATIREQISNQSRLVRKDLRMLGGSNVILIDDDEKYIREDDYLQVRKVKKFDPSYARPEEFVDQFRRVSLEIAESVSVVRKYGIEFSRAHLPFAFEMKSVMLSLLEIDRFGEFKGIPRFKTPVEARIWVRTHPEKAIALIGKSNKRPELKYIPKPSSWFGGWLGRPWGSTGNDHEAVVKPSETGPRPNTPPSTSGSGWDSRLDTTVPRPRPKLILPGDGDGS